MKSSGLPETILKRPEDGPEEGEIVSDDFEDISDGSINFTPSNGKSLSRSDHLQALSLSSVSDVDEIPTPVVKRRKRKRSYCQRHPRRRKRSRRRLSSDSSDDETMLDRRLKLQLKAAVRVDVEEAHRNSLRSRLRAMVQSNSGPDSDIGSTNKQEGDNIIENSPKTVENSTENASENALGLPVKDPTIIEIESGSESVISVHEVIPSCSEIVLSITDDAPSVPKQPESDSEQSKDEIDSELIQLRIEALKTAISNKFANRKRRKKDTQNNASNDETNKENTANNGETHFKKTDNKDEIPQSTNEPDNDASISPDEDEDVLRALLLASMSKKITDSEPEPVKKFATVQKTRPVVINFNKMTLTKKTNNVNTFKINNLNKVMNNAKVINNKVSINTKLLRMPKVKPLIINVNSDSDSDLDLSSSPEKPTQKDQKTSDKGDNKDADVRAPESIKAVIENTVEKFLKEQRAKVESEIQSVNENIIETGSSVSKIEKAVSTVKSIASVFDGNRHAPTELNKNNQNIKKIMTNKPNTNETPILSTTAALIVKTPENSRNLNLEDLEKSALKFLPENKREEYKQLQNLLKIKKAQLKKPRVRKNSQRVESNTVKSTATIKNESLNNKAKNTPQSKITASSKVGSTSANLHVVSTNSIGSVAAPRAKLSRTKLLNKINVNNGANQKVDSVNQLSKMEARKEERGQELRMETERISDGKLLQTTLRQMQTRKDGRLQIQERYKSLQPLIKKINDMSKERKRWDHEVKKLLEQLSEAKKKQHDVHQNLSKFVKDLAERKRKVDDSFMKVNHKSKNIVTSTPMKPTTSDQSLDISAVKCTGSPTFSNLSTTTERASNSSTDNTLTDIHKLDTEHPEKTPSNDLESKTHCDNTWEQSTKVGCNDNLQNFTEHRMDVDLNVVDPNDIDKVIEKTVEKVAVLDKKESFECRRSEKVRYVSPLDSVKREEEFDPFAIMCPYEVNGKCKDPECTFKHLK